MFIALMTVFLESLESLHILANLGSILSVGGLRRSVVPAFLFFQIAAGDRFCFIVVYQDWLLATSCSLAALFHTTRMRMPQLLLAGLVFCFTEEWHVARFVFGIFPR